MLVIDDSKMRLLKMKERLLEISNGTDKKLLDDYKKLVTEIDTDLYEKLSDKLKDAKTHSYSLEEQLMFLSDIEKDYNDLYELRCGYQLTYAKYSDEELQLSDLSNILIDNIRNRKSIVEGYLINTQNIVNTKKELEKLNFMLIQAENKKDEIYRRLKQLEAELKNNILNAEGRVYNDMGSLKYTSIVQEFKDNDLDLKELLNNDALLDEEFSKINEQEVASSEKLQAAKICYQNMPSGENLEVYHLIDVDAARVRYKLILLRIATLISEEAITYTQALEKRMEIISLNAVRIKCLHKLGINLSIDSFERIRLKEQIEIIKSIGDNSKEIADIRRNIDNYNTLIEERMRQNNEFMLTINDNVEFISDVTSFGNIAEDNNVDIPKTINFEEYNYLNKVVKISDISHNFMLARAMEKTSGVINRVNEVYNGVEIVSSKPSTNPELLIVPSDEQLDNHEEEIVNNVFLDDNEKNKNIFESAVDGSEPASLIDNIFIDAEDTSLNNVKNDDMFSTLDVNNKTTDLVDDVFIDKVDDNDKNIFESVVDGSEPASLIDNIFIDAEDTSLNNVKSDDMFSTFDVNNKTTDLADDVFIDKTDNDKKEYTLFTDTVPFESTPLFSDRYDDGVFVKKENNVFVDKPVVPFPEVNSESNSDKVLDNGEITEVFWPTQDKTDVQVPSPTAPDVLSFDEQVNALINDTSKVRKKVV